MSGYAPRMRVKSHTKSHWLTARGRDALTRRWRGALIDPGLAIDRIPRNGGFPDSTMGPAGQGYRSLMAHVVTIGPVQGLASRAAAGAMPARIRFRP
jgi:hypothetical protein